MDHDIYWKRDRAENKNEICMHIFNNEYICDLFFRLFVKWNFLFFMPWHCVFTRASQYLARILLLPFFYHLFMSQNNNSIWNMNMNQSIIQFISQNLMVIGSSEFCTLLNQKFPKKIVLNGNDELVLVILSWRKLLVFFWQIVRLNRLTVWIDFNSTPLIA